MSSKKTIILLFIINIFFIFFSYKTFFCFSKNIIKIHQKLTLILTYDNEKIDIINKINKTAKQLNILKKIKDNNNNTKNNNIKKNIKTKNVKKNIFNLYP